MTLKTTKTIDGAFTKRIDHIQDDMECETPEALQANYDGCPEEEKAKYFTQDKARYEAWLRDEWTYIAIDCTIRLQTSSQWADGGMEVGRASLSGIESDSEPEYIAQVEKELIDEAMGEVFKVKLSLAGIDV